MSKLLMLGRPGCHLCEEMAAAALSAFPALQLLEADVDSREDWQRRWGLKVPVLLHENGELVCATFFDEQAVRVALAVA